MSLYQFDQDAYYQMLSGALANGHYAVVGVTQATGGVDPRLANRNDQSISTTAHWAVVVRISDQYVWINNPYTNRVEMYTRDEFYYTFTAQYVELIPPNSQGK
jgi:uncharacterized protein YvpB